MERQEETIRVSTWKSILLGAGRRKKYVFLIIFSGMAMGGMNLLQSLLDMYIIDRFLSAMELRGFLPIAVLFALVQLVYAVCGYGFGSGSGKLEAHLSADLRHRCFEKVQTLSFSYFDKMSVGHLMSRLTSDISRTMETVSWSLTGVGYGIMSLFGSIIGMFVLNPRLAVILILGVPLVVLVSVVFRRLILNHNRETRRLNSAITSSFNEGITGAVTTKTLVREEENDREFFRLTGSMRKASFTSALVSALYLPVASLVISFATATVLYVGGRDVLGGLLTIGELNFFINIGGMMFEPIRNFAGIFGEVQASQAAAERVAEVLLEEPGVRDTPEVLEKYGSVFAPRAENWEPIRGEVEFRNVSFRYGREPVLEDFSLHVRAGETVALVGETGSGKSTIVSLLCRFYEPVEGQILIDGVDYRERGQLWLQSALGYVLQTPHLFSGTVRENILYGNLQADDEAVRAAARLVGADTFIESLPEGYETQVGEGGGLLSTGQKQLVSFARAVLADPRIFVLDEATSSIDTESEQQIQSAIDTLLGGRTSFVVAHRLSTVRNADRILVIENGRIAEQGNHGELMAKQGKYYELYMGHAEEVNVARSLEALIACDG